MIPDFRVTFFKFHAPAGDIKNGHAEAGDTGKTAGGDSLAQFAIANMPDNNLIDAKLAAFRRCGFVLTRGDSCEIVQRSILGTTVELNTIQ